MSKAYLIDLLQNIRDKMYDTSQLYREAESDKRAHFITLVELDIKAAVRKAVANAMGTSYRKVPRNIKDRINTNTKDMFDNYRDAIKALDKENQTSADIFSSDYSETGSRGKRTITVVFSNKQGKETLVSLLGIENAKKKSKDLIEESIKIIEPFGEKAKNLIDLANFIISRNK